MTVFACTRPVPTFMNWRPSWDLKYCLDAGSYCQVAPWSGTEMVWAASPVKVPSGCFGAMSSVGAPMLPCAVKVVTFLTCTMTLCGPDRVLLSRQKQQPGPRLDAFTESVCFNP